MRRGRRKKKKLLRTFFLLTASIYRDCRGKNGEDRRKKKDKGGW